MNHNHIKRPRLPTWELPKVPLYASRDFDYPQEVPYDKYVEYIGWTQQDAYGGRHSSKSSFEVHRMLQEVLYFGVLQRLFKSAMSNPPTVNISGAQLVSGIVGFWLASHENPVDPEAALSDMIYIHGLCSFSSNICDVFFERDPEYLDQGLVLSIQTLADTIRIGLGFYSFGLPGTSRAWYNTNQFNDRYRASMEGVLVPSFSASRAIIGQKMEQHGWCRSMVHLLLTNTKNLPDLIFTSQIDAPGLGKNHSTCTEHLCNAYQLQDTSTYVTRHAREGCACDWVYTDQQELADILLDPNGAIPTILSKDPERRGDKLYVHLGRSTDDNGTPKPYVAISHVWSDGMGNKNENAIPSCVFETLRAQVSNVHFQAPFWLDTLCVPLKPRKARDEALIRMRQTYEKCHTTLVIDAYLYNFHASGSSTGELVSRVSCAPSSRRLWTLQESILPPRLQYQFAESPRELPDHYHEDTYLEDWPESKCTRSRHPHLEPAAPLHAWHLVSHRSTSVANDEPFCLGSIMGVDSTSLVSLHVEGDPERTRTERMKILWSSVKLDASLCFWEQHPKIVDIGFRWAPRTFMGVCNPRLVPLGKATIEAGKGLRVSLPCVRIECRQTQMTTSAEVYRLMIDDVRYCLVWHPREQNQPWPVATEIIILVNAKYRDGDQTVLPRPTEGSMWKGNVAEVGPQFTAGDGTSWNILRSIGNVGFCRLDQVPGRPDLGLDRNDGEASEDSRWEELSHFDFLRGTYIGIKPWCVD